MEPKISHFFQYKESIFSESSSTAFAGGIFFLFVGFVIGNLFGTFLPSIRIFFSWDGFIVIFLLFFIEFISYIRYQRKNRFFLILWAAEHEVLESGQAKGYAVGQQKQPISFTKDKFPLDVEDQRRKQHPLNNEVTAAKKGKRNDNKITFTSRYPFFIISTFQVGWKSFNYFKIGFLLGFFIDAYKVGS